jgi:phosphoserine phosphatase
MKLNNIKVAFVDFDGTLIKGQSQRMFITFLHQKGFISGFKTLTILFWFMLYKIGVVQDAKHILQFALNSFKGMSVSEIESTIQQFINEYIEPNLRKNSKSLLECLHKNNIETIIFSAAVDIIIKPISILLGADTEILGIQNHGTNKVEKLLSYCREKGIDLEQTISFADHPSDLEFLRSTKVGIVANPSIKMHSIASKYNLPVIYLDIDEPVQYFEFNTVSK